MMAGLHDDWITWFHGNGDGGKVVMVEAAVVLVVSVEETGAAVAMLCLASSSFHLLKNTNFPCF